MTSVRRLFNSGRRVVAHSYKQTSISIDRGIRVIIFRSTNEQTARATFPRGRVMLGPGPSLPWHVRIGSETLAYFIVCLAHGGSGDAGCGGYQVCRAHRGVVLVQREDQSHSSHY